MMTEDRDPGLLPMLLVRARAERVEPITERLVASIARENAAYAMSGVVPEDDLWRSCHDNIERVLDMLVLAVRPDGSLASVEEMEPLFDAARATGRRRAEQGLPLDDLLRSYRIGGRLIWEDLVERADPPLDAESLRDLGVWLWASVDTSSAEVGRAYRSTEHRLLRADSQRMAALWEGLLGGRAREQSFAQEVSRRTNLPSDSPLLLVLIRDTTPDDAAASLAEPVENFELVTAWQARANGDVVGLLALGGHVDERTVLSALTAVSGVDGGVSARCTGLADVDLAFEQARVATEGLSPGAGLVAYDERLVPALLLSSPRVSRRLVDHWLGPLLDLAEGEGAELLTTLDAWVAAGGSTSRTASLVPCHRNTVLNRLARVAHLTGHRLVDQSPPLGLALALEAHQLGLD